jgi:hypothetical protein
MASHEDNAMFDENKYFFPEGAAKIREQRLRQPWLEVPDQRDEQGTPGLQAVPNEQKYVHPESTNKGLYGDYNIPVSLPARTVSAASTSPETTIAAVGVALPPAITQVQNTLYADTAVPEEHDEAPQHSQTEPWSQPVAIDYGRQHWSHPVETPNATASWARPIFTDQNQHHASAVSVADYTQDVRAEPSIMSHQSHYGQPTITATENRSTENVYWARPVEQPAGPASHYPAHHSYSSLALAPHYSDGYPGPWAYGTDAKPTMIGSASVPLIREDMAKPPGKSSLAGSRGDKKRLCYALIGALGLIIASGAIIGGILGSRTSRVPSVAVIPPSDVNTTSATPQTIRKNSRLAVTGYRGDSGNYTLRLFFQDPNDSVRFMDKSSSGGTWTDPVILDTLDYEPMPNGSIAAGSYLGIDPVSTESARGWKKK